MATMLKIRVGMAMAMQRFNCSPLSSNLREPKMDKLAI